MGKARGQGRYAAQRLAVAVVRAVQLSILLAVILLAWCACALALDPSLDISQYSHTAWKIRDGFVKGEIISVAQAPDGYLWLGTEFGLYRFDGVRAVPWQPLGNQQLPGDRIFSLLISRNGALWIGTTKGLASWQAGKLTRYQELTGEIIFDLLEDRSGTIWVAAGGAPTAGKLCAIRNDGVDCFGGDGQLGSGVSALHEDRDGNLWAGVLDGLWRWKPGPPKFYSLPGAPNGILAFADDSDGALLIGWRNGIYRFTDGKVEPYPLPDISNHFLAERMFRDGNDSLWIGTVDLGIVHVHQGRTDVFSKTDGLSGDRAHALFKDLEGSVWVSTTDGLDRFREPAVVTLTSKQGLSPAPVASILSDKDGSVWLATLDGLQRWDRGHVTIPPTGSAKRDGRLNEATPSSLFEDDHGRIWVSTSRELGYLENGKFIPVGSVPGGFVLSIIQDTAGSTWAINERIGLIRISPHNDVRQIPWSTFGQSDSASVLAADRSNGGLWIGFFGGGISYFFDGQPRASYTTSDGLGVGHVSDFYFDDKGTLWVSTEGGLSRLKNNHVATLSSKQGLPCDAVQWAIEDDNHSFWLYTACGLVRIARSELDAWAAAVDKGANTPRSVQVTVLDSSDGLESRSEPTHDHPQVVKTPDGKLWFLPLSGVSVVDPHHIPFNNIPPPVHIENITADDKSYPLSNGVHLPAQIRNLNIDYTALSLVVPEKVRFRVKLEGQDKDWRELVNVRHVEYTNLPPKHYRFRVLACNNSGVWNEAGTFLDFSLAPAYYQTIWFRVSCIAAFLLLLWVLHRLRLRRLAYQFNMRLEERVSERTRIARDLHDTLLQSFQGLMLHFQTGIDLLSVRPGEARKTLEIALDRADQAIAEGRDAVQGLRASTVETNDLASAVRILGEELRAEGINPNSALFEMEVEGTPRNLHPILRDEVYRIAGEALRNAFRHARAQRIEVEILYGERWLRLRVRDDGKGIDPKLLSGDGRAGHYGLHGMRERAKLVDGRLTVWSKLDSGTEVELSIPASTAYANPARHRSWLFEKLSGKRMDFKETDVKEIKTQS